MSTTMHVTLALGLAAFGLVALALAITLWQRVALRARHRRGRAAVVRSADGDRLRDQARPR
jgi:hypothetical protein